MSTDRDCPEGKLEESDEGAIQIAVSRQGGIVRLDFGCTVAWLGLPPKEAADLAILLLMHATNGASIQIIIGRGPVSAAEPEAPKEGGL